MQNQIVLASASPRRKELLTQIGVNCIVQVSDIDETPLAGELPEDFVKRMALDKVRAVALNEHLPVLGADTVVVKDGLIYGKPVDRDDGIAMLQALQGNSHEVMTAVALVWQGVEYQEISKSIVQFRPMSLQDCEAYWSSEEPQDKAGSYAVQGLGAIFIERIEGSYSGVMGLPLYETARLLERVGINPLGSYQES